MVVTIHVLIMSWQRGGGGGGEGDGILLNSVMRAGAGYTFLFCVY